MNRRYFLMSTAAAGALRMNATASPNDTVRIACVGVGAQGTIHTQEYSKLPNVEIAALCDVDENHLNARAAALEKLGKKRPAVFTDFRKLLEDKSIDAVSIATPDHHHTLYAIWGCQAGKDVYVEKPCTHNMFEAKQIVAAQKKYNRIVQHGTNSRTSPAVREGIKQLQDGLIGDVYSVRGLCSKPRNTIGRKPVEPVPAGVHYDLWLGGAPLHEFTQNRFHYNWHWFWDYGCGDIGNQGIHQVDVGRWGLGVTYPTKVTAIGGHFMFDDDQETPNTLNALYEFNDGGKKKIMDFAVRHWYTNHEASIGGTGNNVIGNIFYGTKGYLVIDDYVNVTVSSFLGARATPGPHKVEPMAESGSHWGNFIDAVRSRKQSDLNAPIEEGAISTTLVHLANISYRLGRSINFDAKTFTCPGDKEATAMFTNKYRSPFAVPHLA